FVLQGLIAALPVTLIACGQAAPAAPKPADSTPAAAPPTQAAAPAAQPAATKPAEAKPAGTVVTGANIGGAQPTAIPTPSGNETNPVAFIAPRTKASAPTTLTFWQYVGFHVNVQKEIAAEYKASGDPNVDLEITAYPGLNEQRTAVKAAMAAASPTPDIIAVEPGADTVDYLANGGVIPMTRVFEQDPEYK